VRRYGAQTMARSRKIGGKALVARESGRTPVAARARSKPRTVRFYSDAYDGGRPVGFWRLVARPSGLFCVALMAFLVVSGMQAWQMGLFDPLIGPQGAGPIERGPVRFAPRERAAAKAYTAAPDAPAPAPKAKAADPEESTADPDE
jgi:hypothetical protein